MKVSELMPGDRITHINGQSMDGYDERVIETIAALPNGVARARLADDSPAGIHRWLYDDQHEVEVVRILPDNAHEVISDCLLLMKETLMKRGISAPNVDDVMKVWHRFSTPSTNTEVIIRPKN